MNILDLVNNSLYCCWRCEGWLSHQAHQFLYYKYLAMRLQKAKKLLSIFEFLFIVFN